MRLNHISRVSLLQLDQSSRDFFPSKFQFCNSLLIGHCFLYGSCFDTYVQKIEEAAEKGELDELVLLIIWNRLDLARRDVSILQLILPFYD